MYPKWIYEICQTPCINCRATPTADDIVAIGMTRPAKSEAYTGPLATLVVVCPTCRERMCIAVREPLTSLIQAVRHFARVVDEAGVNTPPPINLPLPKITTGSADLPRPSKRRDQPATPPTQQEIQAFLYRLRKTSFKRDSNGFAGWMKDLGADGSGDTPVEPDPT